MRKDVRFGLTIGAILLAVLVVYVLVVPGERDPDQQVTLETIDPSAPQTEIAAVDPEIGEPAVTDAPTAGQTPAAQPQEMAIITPTRLETTPNSSIASTNTPDQVMAPSGNWDWEKILDTGNMLVATTERRATPAPAAGNVEPVRTESLVPSADTTTATAAPAPAAAAAGTYTVQPGDNFSIIAQKLYGNARYYTEIEKANPGVDSRRLKVGQTINVPDRSSLADTTTAIQASAAAPVQSETEQGGGAAASATVDPARQYRVQPNDSLYRIAQRLYGDGNRWQELHQANRQTIGENPANLKVGMVLTLPEPPSQASAAQ